MRRSCPNIFSHIIYTIGLISNLAKNVYLPILNFFLPILKSFCTVSPSLILFEKQIRINCHEYTIIKDLSIVGIELTELA